jgi:hypothetical protein
MADDEDEEAPPARRHTRKGRPSPVAILHLASSPPAHAAYVALGVLGLVTLAVAILGPKRVRQQLLEPLRDLMEPHAEKAWSDAEPLRHQIAVLLEHSTPAGREHLARDLQSWIGHFRASG